MNAQELFDKIQAMIEAELKEADEETYYDVCGMIVDDFKSRLDAHELDD